MYRSWRILHCRLDQHIIPPPTAYYGRGRRQPFIDSKSLVLIIIFAKKSYSGELYTYWRRRKKDSCQLHGNNSVFRGIFLSFSVINFEFNTLSRRVSSDEIYGSIPNKRLHLAIIFFRFCTAEFEFAFAFIHLWPTRLLIYTMRSVIGYLIWRVNKNLWYRSRDCKL